MDIYHRFFVRVDATNGDDYCRDEFISASYFNTLFLDFFELPHFADSGMSTPSHGKNRPTPRTLKLQKE